MRAEPDLVQAACNGDLTSLERLLHSVQPDLRRFARRTCSEKEDADDAVQFALWQLYRKIGALRTSAALVAWLHRIIVRECCRLFRIRSRYDDWDETLEQRLHMTPAIELRQDLLNAIGVLSPPYRAVFILCAIDELTAQQAAASLGISTDAVKSRLHRAREMVRSQLLAGGYRSGAS
jgi:RNA polymerase sigma factor (sigma-70 family)